jgi:hypothetical protein
VYAVEGRAVVVDGALNIRDLGGLSTPGGRRVMPRRVLRADSLARLEEAGVATLVDDIGVRLIIDLRADEEIEIEGRGAIEARPVAYENLPLRGLSRARQAVVPDPTEIDMATVYAAYLAGSPHSLIRAITLLADSSNLPAVVHCTVGKDRTGVVVAVLLDALGIDHEQIVADYAETAHNMEAVVERLKGTKLFRDVGLDRLPPQVFAAEPDTMRRFLERLTSEHGGAAGWLVQNGLEAATIDELRRALLSD